MSRHVWAGLCVLAASAAGGAPACAADAAPPPLPAWTWSGFYLGAHAGYGFGRDPRQELFLSPVAVPGVDLTDIKPQGWLAGFQAGANWQRGAWVAGIELDVSGTGIRGMSASGGTTPITGTPQTFSGSLAQTDTFDLLGSSRVRLGWLPVPGLLLYGTGGPAWARVDQVVDLHESITGGGVVIDADFLSTTPSWRFGWAAGAGVETRIWDTNWLARLEYLHYDFGTSGSQSSASTFNGVTTPSSAQTSGALTVDLVRAGISYRFGAPMMLPSASLTADPAPLYRKAPGAAPSAAPWTWSGFYLGAHAGYGWGHDPLSEFATTFTATDVDSRGALGGVQAGANWQHGALVGGLEVDLSATAIRGTRTSGASFTGGGGAFASETLTMSDTLTPLGSARARLGYLVWPDTLLYGTGGLAWTELDQTTTDAQVATIPGFGLTASTSTTTPSWRVGWVAGLGAERRLPGSDWLARLEYLHYDFGDFGSLFETDTNAGVTTVLANASSGHLTADVLRAGASYRFGGDGGAGAAALVTKAAPAAGWNGFYAGAHGGYGIGHDPFNRLVPEAPAPDLALNGFTSTGAIGGGQAGANWQAGRWLVGAEFDLSAAAIKGSTSGSTSGGGTTIGVSWTDRFDLLGSARARLGWLPCPDWLLYGTGGLAWTRFVQSTAETVTSPGDVLFAAQAVPLWAWGWVAGVGAETRIAHSNWLGRVEYLHYDFAPTASFSVVIDNTGAIQTAIANTGHLTTDVVRAGLSYSLN